MKYLPDYNFMHQTLKHKWMLRVEFKSLLHCAITDSVSGCCIPWPQKGGLLEFDQTEEEFPTLEGDLKS